MMNREHALDMLASDMRYAQLTAGQAMDHLPPSMRMVLEHKDTAFFKAHAEDPCHEVARACRAHWIWHGDENPHTRQ